jgi:hypothetical protein
VFADEFSENKHEYDKVKEGSERHHKDPEEIPQLTVFPFVPDHPENRTEDSPTDKEIQ